MVDRLRVLSVGLLIIRALLFGLHIRATDFWKLPYKLRIQRLGVLGLELHATPDW